VSSLALERVSVTAGRAEILRELDLDVAHGEWLALIGPNGAGKTTALRAMAGLVRFEGRVVIDGVPLDRLGRRALARAVAMVPQEPALPPAMTVFQYALLGRTPHLGYLGREGAADRRLVLDTLARLDVEGLAERQLGSLSGGERQRAVIARALVQRPRIVLLDEPTSALDVGHQQEVLELVAALRRDERLTVVSAMHDLTLAGQFAERVVLLAGGRSVSAGPPREVLTEAAINHHYNASVRVLDDGERSVVVPTRRAADAAGRATAPVPVEPPAARPRARARSLVVVNTGDGKGKSTAGFGIVMRAVARDWRVIVIQFIKSGRWKTGEEKLCRRLGVEWWSIGDGFTWESKDLSETELVARAAWQSAQAAIASAAYDLVVLDELTYPINWGWLAVEDVVAAIAGRPDRVNVVVTGRDAPRELLEVADTATEMVKLRHAYDRGVIARRGIDF
jgi:iron complex transport system ATP-binding protein